MPDNGKVVRVPDRATIETEASAWVARIDAGGMKPSDWAAFEAWKAQSAHHAQAAERLSDLWADLDGLSAFAPVVEAPAGLARRGRRAAASRPARRAVWATAAAASVALLVGGGVWNLERTAPKLLAYETPVGAERTVTLEDGSVVQLNTASRLEVLYHGERRDLRLARGEAYFEVAPNPRRPFIVYAGPGAVRAVGTAFAVRVQPNGLNVTLTKGAVELSAVQSGRREAVALADAHTLARHAVAHMVAAPGSAESAVIAQGQVEVRELSASETARRLSWRQGTLVFEGERLQDVVNEVSRYTLVKIDIPDPQLRSLRIAGYFNAGDVEPMFEALQAGFGVRVERIDARHVRLERASPPRADAARPHPAR